MSKKYIIKNGKTVEVSDEVYKILRKWDRRIKYVEHDLKETQYIIDRKKETVREIPSREDSLDRLTALGFDFADRSADFRESVAEKIMLDQALEKLSDEERYLITQLFYFGRNERELAAELNVTRRTINNRKRKILSKLRELFGK
ncbi:MAG: sigma-70 family RNA polymerase sigma factor [Lachnospiraceae bacterium]|nr:sigma-70 family RNA polymerase sigma factor [Ruminococcus sp.]MCM1276249.1 sigma-70 family RNA polymerase sigma factor [Lachnospiraceae bacterium]